MSKLQLDSLNENQQDGRDGKDGRDGVATKDEILEIIQAKQAEIRQGLIEELKKDLPRAEPRGVWESGTKDYAVGNIVVLDGTSWICRVAGTIKKPGNLNDDWMLLAKRGRDGRDRTK